jgi:hypothetical protein
VNGIRPRTLLAICAGVAALGVPLAFAMWLPAHNSFIGGLTMVGSSDGQPREIATGWLFVLLGFLAALAYAVPAGLSLVLMRRLSDRARKIAVVVILPVALWCVWYRLTFRG